MSGSTASTPGSTSSWPKATPMSTASQRRLAPAPVAVEREVHADLADAAERHEDQFVRRRHQCRAVAAAPKCTSPAVIAREEPSPDRTISRPSSSIVSNVPRKTSSPILTAIGAPSPAARSSQRSRIAAKPRPSFQSCLLLDPRLGKRREERLGADVRAAFDKRGRRIGHPLRRMPDVDADADHHAVLPLGAASPPRAGCRRPWRRRTARRSAISELAVQRCPTRRRARA